MLNRYLLVIVGIAAIVAPTLPTVATPSNSISESSILIAQNTRVRRLQFARGSSSASVTDSVIRGERNVYVLRANGRQTMTVNISSTQAQGGALFDVISPDGVILETGVQSFSQQLPKTGEYRIVVGGSRGNASYRMSVSIR